MSDRSPLECSAVDELAPAYAVDALDANEEHAVSTHLATCSEAHAEARSLIGAAAAVPASLEPVAPSASLRDRLMATVAETAQDHRTVTPVAAPIRQPETQTRREPWWQLRPLAGMAAAAGVVAAVGLGAWGVMLNNQLAEREAALQAVASADAIHPASGEAGSGWVIESGNEALFIADDLEDLPSDRLYELWLLTADGEAIPAGVLTDTDGVAVVDIEGTLEGAATFALTVESERVDAPTSDPVLVGSIEG